MACNNMPTKTTEDPLSRRGEQSSSSHTEPPTNPDCTVLHNDERAQNKLDYLDGWIRVVNERVSRLKAHRNTHVPLSRLPPETLSMIFVECASHGQSEFSCGRTIRWIAITSVCRRWRSIALQCPEIWGNLVFARPGVTAAMLRLSKAAPIVVKASLSLYPRPSMEGLEMVLLALQHLCRTRVLHLGLYGLYFCHSSQIASALCNPAPLLESFRMITSSSLTLPDVPFSGQTPQLRYLDLHCCKFSWEAPLLKNLNHLEIHKPVQRPTMTQILAALDNMPLLNTLILEQACPTSDDSTSGHVDRTVQLSRLSVLSIGDHVSDCTNLLNRISYPTTSTVRLACMASSAADFGEVFPVMLSTGGWDRAGKSIRSLFVESRYGAQVCIRGWITAYRPPSYLHTTTAQFELTMLSLDGDARALMLNACKALPLSNIQTLHVGNEGYDSKWIDVFRNSPRLRTISFCGSSAIGLMQALQPMNRPDFLSPRLRILVLEGVNKIETGPDGITMIGSLLACLRQRFRRNIAIKELHLQRCRIMTEDVVAILKPYVHELVWVEAEEWSGSEEDEE